MVFDYTGPMKTNREEVSTTTAPSAVGPYSQAVAVGEMLYTAGQIPLDPESGELVSSDTKEQIAQVLRNLDAVLRAGQSTPSEVVKITCFLVDMADFPAVNEAFAEFFTQPYPARSCVQVAALPKGARVEVEAVALRSV